MTSTTTLADVPATGARRPKTSDERNKEAATFIKKLEKYVPSATDERQGDRAALSALRRGLGKEVGGAPEMFPYIVPILPPGLVHWDERHFYLVASLFALSPTFWPEGNDRQSLGKTMRLLALDRAAERGSAEGDEDEKGAELGRLDKAVERRFVALLNADAEAESESFTTHLRHAVTLLKSGERPQPIDWTQLLIDLCAWNTSSRMKQKWARDFWSPGPQSDKAVAPRGDETDADGSSDTTTTPS